MPGPVPKRSEERRRRNAPAAGEPVKLDIDKLPDDDPNGLPFLIKQPIIIPEAGSEQQRDEQTGWHPLALEMWESFKRSGQALLWEPSDWAMAKLFCESLSRDLLPQVVGISPASEFGPAEVITERIPLKGASLGAYLKMANALMLTEGDRRRLALELQRPRVEDDKRDAAKVVPIKDRKTALLRASE